MQYLANMVSENVAQDIGEIFNLCEMLGLPFELRQAPVYTHLDTWCRCVFKCVMFCIWHFRLETGSAPLQFT